MSQLKPKETKAYLYNISYEPGFLHEFFHVPMEAITKLNTFYPRLEKDAAACIPELIELCGQYPALPQFKNMLGVAYHYSGNTAKAGEINNLIISEHPDYLFAKINKAYEYLALKQPEKVRALLGEWMEIKELYPERDIFHVAEVLAFYKLAFHYYMALGNADAARSQLQVMETVDPDHPDTIAVRQKVLHAAFTFAKPAKRKK